MQFCLSLNALNFVVLADHFTLLFICLTVATCQSDSEGEPSQVVEEASDLGVVGEEDSQDFGDVIFGSAPGVNTVCVFPKNSARSKCSTRFRIWLHFFYFFDKSDILL